MNREKFIENLKSIREERCFTQKQVAEALGVSDRTYSKWETGDTEPGIELICRLAEFYGCAATDFFAEKTPKESNPVRAELRDLTPVQAMLRTRDIQMEGQLSDDHQTQDRTLHQTVHRASADQRPGFRRSDCILFFVTHDVCGSAGWT